MKLHTCSSSAETPEIDPSVGALDSTRTVAFVFGSTSLMDHPDFVRSLRLHLPRAHLIGCSTSGEVHHTAIRDNSISIAVAAFEHTQLSSACVDIAYSAESAAAGQTLARKLDAPDLKAVFVLSDGLRVNGTELIRGFNEVFKHEVVITGGLAGDGARFERTWVLGNEGLRSGQIAAIGFYGDRVRVGHGSRGGWDKFGVVRKVTAATGNTLYELDGKPALAVYKEYLGERSNELPASALLFPLTLLSETAGGEPLVRTVLAIDEASNSMTFAGDIPLGAQVQLMRANFDRLVESASNAAVSASAAIPAGSEVLSIAISCVGRRLVLGERTEEELEAALEHLSSTTRQVGFYSYGEISPVASGSCELHNQTMTLTTLTEV